MTKKQNLESDPVLNELHFSGEILLTRNKMQFVKSVSQQLCLGPSPHYCARPILFESRGSSDRLVFFDLRVLRNPIWELHVIIDRGKVQL